MVDNTLNLLPSERVRALKRNYFLRLAAVAMLAAAFLAFAHLALLAPSYVYGRISIADKESTLAELSARLVADEEREVDARLKALALDSAYLGRLTESPGVSDAARALLAVSRPGITISGMTFAASTAKESQKMTLSGTAGTRTALRQYIGALSSLPGIKSADVPISTYAQEANIRFTITLQGVPHP